MLRGWRGDRVPAQEGLRDLARLRLQPGHVPRSQLGQSQTIVVLVYHRQGGVDGASVRSLFVPPVSQLGQLLQDVAGVLVETLVVVLQVTELAQTLTPQ